MLYLIATPIGNLKDITYRAIELLKNVDLILCEDTRVSKRLLQAYEIKTPLKSFHKFNEARLEASIIHELAEGKEIALISDAGTPGISDPGHKLIYRCIDEKIPITSIPGPSAPIAALILSGFSMEQFQFLGFLSKKPSERKQQLILAFYYPGATLFFESPNRIHNTLQEIAKLSPDQDIAVVREITKKYEEVLRGKAKNLLNKEIRGEIVLVIDGYKKPSFALSIKEHIHKLQKQFQINKQDAIKLAAHLRGVSKKDLYSRLIMGDETSTA